MSKVDLYQLRIELRKLERHQKLYKLLKEELTTLGFWRVKPRGDPAKGLAVMKERKQLREEET